MSRPETKAGTPPLVTSTWVVPAAVAALLVALAGLLAWQYAMPDTFESSFRLDHAGLDHFRRAFGLPRLDVPLATYAIVFRVVLGAAWIAYFVAVGAGAGGGRLPSGRTLCILVVAVALVAAVFWPPSFSCDVYGYVAYGRMRVLHGWNPYLTSQKALDAAGDPVGRFLMWGIGSPYGPLWTILSTAIVALLRGAGLLAQVIAFKLVGAAAVAAAAFVGRRVAERLEPGRGDLTLMAIGLNPLFILEGAGNAHNDLVMMALVVVALGAATGGKTRTAALWAGVAAAVKFLPLLLVPWLALGGPSERARGGRERLRTALVVAILAALPTLVAFAPYWEGPRTLAGLSQRWQSSLGPEDSARASLWAQGGVLLLAWAAATRWFARGERDRLLFAWIAVSAVIYLLAAGVWLPWYISWMWIVALLGWDRRALTGSYLAACFAVVMTMRYSIAHFGP